MDYMTFRERLFNVYRPYTGGRKAGIPVFILDKDGNRLRKGYKSVWSSEAAAKSSLLQTALNMNSRLKEQQVRDYLDMMFESGELVIVPAIGG